MKARREFDPRWTLSPEGAAIVVGSGGFSLTCDGDVILQLRWDQVHQIGAFTRFRQSEPELCLSFAVMQKQSVQVVVHERVKGWDDLCAALPAVFRSADADWRAKAAHDRTTPEAYASVASNVPVFTVNPTVVWAK